MEKNPNKAINFTTDMVKISETLQKFYPNLTDYEVLTLSLNISKNVLLDDISEHLDSISEILYETNISLNDVNNHLYSIQISMDFITKINFN
jgi:hypothetical protein